MKIFGSIISEESTLRLTDFQTFLEMIKEHDIHELGKTFRTIHYLGIEFDSFDGYRKTCWEVEK